MNTNNIKILNRTIILFFSFLVIFNSILFSQVSDNKLSKKNKNENNSQLDNKQVQPTNEQNSQVISPNFISGDIVFIFNSFNTIELKATEVDAFISSVDKLKIIIENPNFQKLTSDVPVKVDIEIQAAENILNFCKRITMSGANVVRYKRFINAIYDAAKVQP